MYITLSTVSEKNATLFSTMVDFYNVFTSGNINEYSIIPCNLLTQYLDDIVTVTHYKSQQFNFSLHVKINHIKYEDKFFIKTHENVKDCPSEDC